ncbi:MAG: FtsX-like permease family protein [Actinobacteria bacterium]|uniref:Cell division protein FtsX n=1 Tax=freshwater metagenome TaxID=449393 RepID=A0A6J5YZR8_9ZZZZ|nr:FtsX-like permease family protein [Actinomycetota bacterium]
MRAGFISNEVKTGLRRNLTMTVALVVSVAVSLTLLGTALLMRAQVDRMKGYWYDKIEVSIFLCGNNSLAYTCTGAVTDAQRKAVKKKLTGLDPTVQDVFYESTADAYDRFKTQFKGSAIISSIEPDALPESFRVKLDNPANFDQVAEAVQSMQGVESVQDQRKLLDRFFQILTGLQSFAMAVAMAMLLVTILLVVNTVRVAAFARRRETSIMRSVGASNMTIRLPFILEAGVAAAGGAALASTTMILIKQFLIDGKLAPQWSVIAWVTWQDVLWIVPWIFIVGLSTAVGAASVSLSRYLRG